MPSVVLDDGEWQQVIAILAQAPWQTANPLLMKIGGQLRGQSGAPTEETARPARAGAVRDGPGPEPFVEPGPTENPR